MRLLLDTYTIVKLTEGSENSLSAKTRRFFMDPGTDRLLSTVSLTEIAIKRAIGKIGVDRTRLSIAIQKLAISVIPYTEEHADKLFELPLLHRDPFDRMLIATALAEDVPIVSVDRQLPKYRGLRVLS